MLKYVTAIDLKPGNVLALPFGKTATITGVRIGWQYMNLKLADLPPTRIGKFDEVLIELPDECEVCGTVTKNFNGELIDHTEEECFK